MIKTKKGQTTLKGTVPEIATDLSTITRSVVEGFVKNEMTREEAVGLVKHSFELALKTEDELRAEAHQKIGKFLLHLGECMVDDSEEQGEEDNE